MAGKRIILSLTALMCVCRCGSVAASDSEVARLQRENRELRDKLIRAEQRLSEYRLWLGNVTLNPDEMKPSDRELRALHLLEGLSKRGNELSMAALAVRDECRKLLVEMPLGPARKAQVELRLDELTRSAGEFAGMTIPSDSHLGSSRILAVDRNLRVVVISSGSTAGVFVGMIFKAKHDPELKIRVIGTRVEGAVAEVLSGNPNDIVPGMEFSALYQVKENKPGK